MKSRCLAFFNYQQSFLEIKKYIYIYSLIYFWLCWVLLLLPRLFSSCNEQELLLVAVLRLLMVVASLAAEHKL